MRSGSIGPVVCLLAFVAGCKTSEPPKEFVYLDETPVRITEIHFEPSDEQGDVEYVEIANTSKSRVDVSGWQITGAGRVALPPGTTLDPGKAAVLCKDHEALASTFGTGVVPVALLTGKLSNKGEIVRLEDPDGRVADEVEYDETDPEVAKAAGTGLSIHRARISPTTDRSVWGAAEPSPGAVKLKTR